LAGERGEEKRVMVLVWENMEGPGATYREDEDQLPPPSWSSSF